MLANRWGTISMAAMFLVYFLVYLGFLMVGFHQLHSRPSGSLRMAVILFRLQVGAMCPCKVCLLSAGSSACRCVVSADQRPGRMTGHGSGGSSTSQEEHSTRET